MMPLYSFCRPTYVRPVCVPTSPFPGARPADGLAVFFHISRGGINLFLIPVRAAGGICCACALIERSYPAVSARQIAHGRADIGSAKAGILRFRAVTGVDAGTVIRLADRGVCSPGETFPDGFTADPSPLTQTCRCRRCCPAAFCCNAGRGFTADGVRHAEAFPRPPRGGVFHY